MSYNRRAWGILRVGAVCVAAWALLPGAAAAQGQKVYSNKNPLSLPIQIDEAHRPHLREVVLYVKHGDGPWMRAAAVPPTQREFTYRVPQDGEYCFSVVTVDRAGVACPPDVSLMPPGLRIVVDTRPPAVELLPTTHAGVPALRCVVRDANPNNSSVKVVLHGPVGPRALAAVPGDPGLFPIPAPVMQAGHVQATASDHAGNAAKPCELNLREVFGPPPQPAPAQPAPAAVPLSAVVAGDPPPPQRPLSDNLPLPPGVPQAPATAVGPSLTHRPPAAQLPPASPPAPAIQQTQSNRPNLTPDAGPVSAPPGRQLISSRRASIEYRVDPVGVSGVGKIDVWVTTDRGATWQRLGEDADRRSPAEMTLPGEGLYGVRLSVTNGSGFGGTPPAPGEAPTSYVEVDTTPPAAQLLDVEPCAGGMEVRWTASDKNLGLEPVSLWYAARREGPWQPAVTKVRNEGRCRLSCPRDIGGQFFLRLEVTDLAGNTTRCDTPSPVTLDMTEPRATVVTVTGIPVGN